MSIPALRQPKFLTTLQKEVKKADNNNIEHENVIVTLRDQKQLILSSDAYHGILWVDDMYKCVFCDTVMELDTKFKELHKSSAEHCDLMISLPYVEECSDDLVRKINKNTFYCAICNAIVTSAFLSSHIASEVHIQMLKRATARVLAYKTSK